MLSSSKKSLLKDYVLVTFSYLLALLLGIGTAYFFSELHFLWQVLIADFVATAVVFAFSYIYSNSSFYDPYWSVIPIIIALSMIFFAEPVTLRQGVVFILVAAWGLRLTFNWVRRWTGIEDEDWRYVDLQKQTGGLYWLVSFLGIHLFPTVVVFLSCLPLYPVLMLSYTPFNGIDVLAFLVTAIAIVIETLADNQLREFIVNNKEKSKFLDKGLWAYSRHPNYFGEILFWWGIFLFVFATDQFAYWWTGIGALSITLMFVFISLPMIDQRFLKNKTGYAEHIKKVSALIPWFPRKN